MSDTSQYAYQRQCYSKLSRLSQTCMQTISHDHDHNHEHKNNHNNDEDNDYDNGTEQIHV